MREPLVQKFHTLRQVLDARPDARSGGEHGRELLAQIYGEIARRHPERFTAHIEGIVNAVHNTLRRS